MPEVFGQMGSALKRKAKKKTGTIKTDLGSVIYFYQFALLNNKVETLPSFPLDIIQTLEAMIG